MDKVIQAFRRRLAECKTEGAIDKLRDETWNLIPKHDHIRNTIVLSECGRRRMWLKGAPKDVTENVAIT